MSLNFSPKGLLNFLKSGQLKVVLSSLWLALTFSIVSWWFYNSFYLYYSPDYQNSPEHLLKHQRMILWEGGFLLAVILIGGVVLIHYVRRDHDRHEKLKFFFANFTHDIKTSITRLKLQAELLSEDTDKIEQKSMQRLMNDLSRLDLQLENSLLLTQIDDSVLLNEKINLNQLIDSLKIEFTPLNIKIEGQIHVEADIRALRSLIRNIFENAIRHGKAKNLIITAKNKEPAGVLIYFSDDGLGAQTDLALIGQGLTPFRDQKSNGIGLYLANKLIHKMRGSIEFKHQIPQGFQVVLTLVGHANQLKPVTNSQESESV